MWLKAVDHKFIVTTINRAFANSTATATAVAERSAVVVAVVTTAEIFMTLGYWRFKAATAVITEGTICHCFYLNMNINLKSFQYCFSNN
jgi:hypothetical protein